ncbi:MAG: hypothetical protein ACEQSA_01530 [Weeksellaceae bacterium]
MKVPVRVSTDGELLIKVGQIVDFKTPLKRSKSKKHVTVPLADLLKFKPEKIFLLLKKGIGDALRKGEMLAESKTMFSTKQYVSEFDGVLKEIDHETGSIVVEVREGDQETEFCFFSGEVTGIEQDIIELKVNKVQEFPLAENKQYVGSEVFYHFNPTDTVTDDDIDDKCICTLELSPLDNPKLEALGAKGLITFKKPSILSSIKHLFLKKEEDLHEVMKHQLPYCIVSLSGDTIYFYQ